MLLGLIVAYHALEVQVRIVINIDAIKEQLSELKMRSDEIWMEKSK